MATQELAVVGGGAKAAALVAKAYCLRQTGKADVHVTIFESEAIGAHWDGRHGYSDGEQPLCTVAERDLGFPYDPDSFGPEVAQVMLAEFSWIAHTNQPPAKLGYADWVSRGRRRPTHGEFAAYLRDSVARSAVEPIIGRVTGLSHRPQGWTVDVASPAQGIAGSYGPYHGVVVTSPGPHSTRVTRPADARVFDGQSFWRQLGNVRDIAEATADPLVIIGGGGTSAAIAAWFVRAGFGDREIVIIADQPTLHTRVDNLFENRLFNDEDAWRALHRDHQKAFRDRLIRSVVWESVTEQLSEARQLVLLPGRASAITAGPPEPEGALPELLVHFRRKGQRKDREQVAGLVVDASGFDGWWFADLLPGNHATDVRSGKDTLARTMKADLSLDLAGMPGLHAPMVSHVWGPGYGSLMVLGAMADRILKPYVDASRS